MHMANKSKWLIGAAAIAAAAYFYFKGKSSTSKSIDEDAAGSYTVPSDVSGMGTYAFESTGNVGVDKTLLRKTAAIEKSTNKYDYKTAKQAEKTDRVEARQDTLQSIFGKSKSLKTVPASSVPLYTAVKNASIKVSLPNYTAGTTTKNKSLKTAVKSALSLSNPIKVISTVNKTLFSGISKKLKGN